ncbi:hypothetical protein F0344_00525 [Streptomyces finlayi]|uniref:Uncharacterized protein n=1 Tax=Streptomyces finlayi TaxID=67296 RepID=A0A7G7BD93_9ACTN|nr:hypothetical protein F0344_00525 [Streptomyces finlayi]
MDGATTVHVTFIDEIFKCSTTALNTLVAMNSDARRAAPLHHGSRLLPPRSRLPQPEHD